MSSNLISPICTASINGHPVRFFKSPVPGPDMPWHALADLMAATGHTSDQTLKMLQMTRNGPFAGDTRRIATADGLVVIAPHFMAQGLIGAMTDAGRVSKDFERSYCEALSLTFDALVGDLPPMARLEMLMAMAKGGLDHAGAPE